MNIRIILAATAIIGGSYSTNAQQYWIIGGQSATEGQFPWLGDVRKNNQHFCGSSLIHPSWVLTAGHCFGPAAGTNKTNTVIRFNTVRRTGGLNPNGGEQRAIKNIFVHWGYDEPSGGPTLGYDIALIELDQPVTTIMPVGIPSAADAATMYQVGSDVKIAGWGLKDTSSQQAPDTMKWCNSKIQNPQMPTPATDNDLSFCAGYTGSEPQSGSAAGDSGGPLWKEINGSKIVFGLTSMGLGPTTLHNSPGFFTKVAKYRQWIDSVMAANGTPNSISTAVWTDDQVKVGASGNSIIIFFGDMQTDKVTITLYNIDGKTMYRSEVATPSMKQHEIRTADLATGMYMLRVTDNRGRYFTKKLLNASAQ